MAAITDTQFKSTPEGMQRLLDISPYSAWVAERYGTDAAAPASQSAKKLKKALHEQWKAFVQLENLPAPTGIDTSILEAQQRVIRQFRHTQMLQILEADLNERATLSVRLAALSALAKACIQQAISWAEEAIELRYGKAFDQQEHQVHLLVIGMGKLGGCELNVSSDIDLIFGFRQNGKSSGPKVIETSEWCRRVAQRANQILNANTEDGIAYRVDTRLRPFGDSGPLVMSFEGMEHYYLTQGRNWERYAMVKAAVMSGTPEDADEWQSMINPFVYRRYLDYSTIEALADLKQKINTNLQRKEAHKASATWNVKLGHGGIREIEFIVQSFQMVRGGRDPDLQNASLLPVLGLLADKNLLSDEDRKELTDAYVFLRRTENALQSFRDQQVHNLPNNDDDKSRLIQWMGFDQWEQFDSVLQGHRDAVTRRFDEVFQGPEEEGHVVKSIQDSINEHNIAINEALEAHLEELTEGRIYQRLTANAQRRIDRIIPTMIGLCAQEEIPSQSLTRCLALVRVVAGRSGYLQVLIEQPAALKRLVHVLSESRWISDFITKHPIVIDELLVHTAVLDFPNQQELMSRVMSECARVAEEDLDVQMDALRQFQKAHECRVAMAEITNDLPLMHVSDQLTWLAEGILCGVMTLVNDQLTAVHGKPQFEVNGKTCNASVGIVAYGKLGGLELAHGSDLDVVFLHNSAGSNQMTTGDKPIPNAQFYARLAQRVVSFMTTLTPAGTLYEMDLRLRPNGNSGVLVTGIDAFEKYQLESAWTWEHQALSRARMVFGPESLAKQFQNVRHRILSKNRDDEALRDEVRNMRRKMRDHLGSKESEDKIDLKQDAGGLADIEFIVQYLVLAYAEKHPELIEFTDNIRQLEAATREGLLDETHGVQLKEHYLAFRTYVHRQALQGYGKRLIENAELAQRRHEVRSIWQHVLDVNEQ